MRLYKYSLQIPLKVGKNEDFESTIFFEAQKCYFVFESRLNFFFPNGHIRNVVSTLPNVAKIDVENDIVWTLSNVVQFNVKIYNIVLTLLNVVNFNVDVQNVVSTLIWRCATSWRHINLKRTLNWRWNVCWATVIGVWDDSDVCLKLVSHLRKNKIIKKTKDFQQKTMWTAIDAFNWISIYGAVLDLN